MRAVHRPAVALLTAAALLATACDSGGDDPGPPAASGPTTAPAPSSSAPADTAATVRVEVSAGDVAAAAAVLRARLRELDLGPYEPQVAGRTVTYAVTRALTPAEAAGLGQPGRLAFRRVITTLPPDGKAEETPDGDCADEAYRARLAAAATDPASDVVVCARAGDAKYVLGAAEDYGAVESADAGYVGSVATGEPLIELTLSDAAAWQRLTERYLGKQLAIVVDGVVHTAPTIAEAIPNGTVVISGLATAEEAALLAAVLTEGPLEAEVTVTAG